MCACTQRVELLRERVLDKETIKMEEPALYWARSWMATGGEPWHIIRRARATAAVLRNSTPVIDPDELIVGKYCPRDLTPGERQELENWNRYAVPAITSDQGQRAHMAVDYERLLRLGVTGIREEINARREGLDLADPEEMEKDAFYRACLIALDGLVDYSSHYADHAEHLAAVTGDQKRKQELLEIARVCRKVPLLPADTFREALQAVHFLTFSLCAGQRMHLFQLGRPDRYLLPFYRRDLVEGRITPEEAQELIDCLCIMFNEYTPRGLAVGFMVGGTDSSGMDVTNELTYMFIESIAHTRLSYPGIGLCWTPETPQDLMNKAYEMLGKGYTHPAIFNDQVISRGLINAGLPPSEACLYTHSTCVEITPVASSNVYVASPYINLVQVLHDVLNVPGVGSGSDFTGVPDIGSFDKLLALYRERLREVVRSGVIAQNTAQQTRRYHGGFPLLSCFVNDCLLKGKDIDHGGARYNWIEPSFVGLANLVDSLAVIHDAVFESQEISLNDLAVAMYEDFRGQEDLRQRLLTRVPKYGNDDDRADRYALDIVRWITEECYKYRTYLGGDYHPGMFCWIMHEQLGRQTRASAGGRKAGFPLADGSGPAQGRENRGPTAAVKSVTKWDHSPMIGGIAVNLKFSPGRNKDEFIQKMGSAIESFLRLGGFEVQVNVVDRETLIAARENPEEYKDLVVRIAGYSDYFTRLSPEMQEEILMRTEYD